jgi:small subunit ribosomal protein S6e
LKTISLIP